MAGHTEHIHPLLAVRGLFRPGLIQNFHTADTVYLEYFVLAIFQVICTNVNIVRCIAVWFNQSVAQLLIRFDRDEIRQRTAPGHTGYIRLISLAGRPLYIIYYSFEISSCSSINLFIISSNEI